MEKHSSAGVNVWDDVSVRKSEPKQILIEHIPTIDQPTSFLESLEMTMWNDFPAQQSECISWVSVCISCIS